MGLYADHIFPRLMDYAMRGPRFQALRARALAPVSGHVLEIGFGTGLNLPHYPPTLTWLTAIEPGPVLTDRVAARTADVAIPVQIFRHRAEHTPWESGRFDWVVSTWTLCTIADPGLALREVRRLLKPDGGLTFLEHGRSEDPKVARYQDLLTPIQRRLACGCHLNRPIERLIRDAGFAIERLDRFTMDGVPRIAGEMYLGIAKPARC